MSEYLQPNEQGLSIEDQRYLFAVRNRMVDIPANFPQKNRSENKETCICGQVEDMAHIYSCTKLNKSEEINCEEFANIYSGNLNKQIKVFKRFQRNFEIREQYLNETEQETNTNETHAIPSMCDPLLC